MFCSLCIRKKSIAVSDNTIQTQGLASFFKHLEEFLLKLVKKLATNVLKNPGRALEITSNNATSAATKNCKATLSSLPEVMKFYHTGKRLYLVKFVNNILNKRNKQNDYTLLHL